MAAATSTAAALASFAIPAQAEQVLLQTSAAHVSLEPIAADATLGGRARIAASLGPLNTSLTAAIETGGGQLSLTDTAWATVMRPSSWSGDDMQFAANWALQANTQLTLDAGDHERRTRNFTDPLGSSADQQQAVNDDRFIRLHFAAQGRRMDLYAAAEAWTNTVDTLDPAEPSSAPTRLWMTSRQIFGRLTWRPFQGVSLEAGETAKTFDTGWRGADALESNSAYLTPSLALALAASPRTRWRVEFEKTVNPIDPGKFAAYAQLAAPSGDSVPQPDVGWRYALSLDQQLPGGATLTARATHWRMASVTDFGPVGLGEAPVSIGAGLRQELDLNLTAPLADIGLAGATLAGDVSWRRSRVDDAFTDARRPISGETPYRAQLRLAGALPASGLTWSLTAKAEGPQSLYQMARITSLGATAGLGGALRYDAGRVRLSLDLDNLVGGTRQVTTYIWSNSRADGRPNEVDRRSDDARAVRISLRRAL